MRKVLLTLIIFVIGFPTSAEKINPSGTPLLSAYQKSVISYFIEIALGYEYGSASNITRKWTKTMKVYLDGSANHEHLQELEQVIAELNNLATDGFQIEIVATRTLANLHLFIGTAKGFTAFYPADSTLAKSNSGIYRVFWNSRNEIVKGYIFIKNSTSMIEQKHAIREELTQSLGLGKDSSRYMESIFQLNYTLPTQFAPIDRDIIRLLYHPKITPGLSAQEVNTIAEEILISESGV